MWSRGGAAARPGQSGNAWENNGRAGKFRFEHPLSPEVGRVGFLAQYGTVENVEQVNTDKEPAAGNITYATREAAKIAMEKQSRHQFANNSFKISYIPDEEVTSLSPPQQIDFLLLILVPTQFAGAIIRKEGLTIKTPDLNIYNLETTIILKGTVEACASAEIEIMKKLPGAFENDMLTGVVNLFIPTQAVGAIIRKKGAHTKQVVRFTGASIKAQGRIFGKLKEENFFNSKEEVKLEAYIRVPSSTPGWTVNELQNLTSAEVIVPRYQTPDENKEVIVRIVGHFLLARLHSARSGKLASAGFSHPLYHPLGFLNSNDPIPFSRTNIAKQCSEYHITQKEQKQNTQINLNLHLVTKKNKSQ
ncbi:Insulin-like growth factor 2 mRNA-binding protein 2, partial [Plecturocebus cupreus]